MHNHSIAIEKEIALNKITNSRQLEDKKDWKTLEINLELSEGEKTVDPH